MPSLTAASSPYDVLSPVSTTPVADDTQNDQVDDQQVDDQQVDDQVDDTDAGTDTDEGEADADADAAEGDDQHADDDPAAKEAAEAAKTEEAQWKAKDGNLPPALKELIQANPNAAKRLKEMYFTNQRLMKFGPAAEIKKMKEAVDSIGGAEKLGEIVNQINSMGGEAGFQESIQELGAWRDIDSKWVAADPALVDHLASVNPASFEKIAPAMFGKLYDVNLELYNNLGAQIIMQTFAGNGTLMDFNLMRQALAAGDAKTAASYADKINANLAGLDTMSKTAPKQKAADPEKAQWEQERAGYQQEKQDLFVQDVLRTNLQWMGTTVKTELGKYLNGAEKKLSEDTTKRLDHIVREEIWTKHLSTNEQFMKQRQGLLQKGDKDGLVRLFHQYSDSLFPTVTRRIAKEFALSPAAKRNAGQAQTGGNGKGTTQQKAPVGVTMVDKHPKPEEVDNRKTSFDMKLKDTFVLKDGRTIKVRPLKM